MKFLFPFIIIAIAVVVAVIINIIYACINDLFDFCMGFAQSKALNVCSNFALAIKLKNIIKTVLNRNSCFYFISSNLFFFFSS